MKSAKLLENSKERSGFIWNMIGSGVYAIVSMLLGTVVMRVLGANSGGIFFFAFSTLGQHVYTVAYFAMRPIHIVDVSYEYSFSTYRNFRLLTGAAALLLAVIVGFVYAGFSEKTAVIIIIAIYKILDAICDCYESEFQRDGRLDMTGKSMTFRTVVSIVAFLLTACTTRNLVLACVVMVIAMAGALIFGCIWPLKKLFNENLFSKKQIVKKPVDEEQIDKEQASTKGISNLGTKKEEPGSLKKLFGASVWLAVSILLDLYVFSASKYAVDANLSPGMSGYYATIFIPTSVIYLLANFVIRPLLTKLSQMQAEGKRGEFKAVVGKIGLMIGGLTVLGVLCAWLLGVPVMKLILGSILEGTTVEALRLPLMIIIAGGGMYAWACLFYYVLVILKKQKLIFAVYLAGAVVAGILANVMVKANGINGGAWSYLISMTLVAGAFYIIYERS